MSFQFRGVFFIECIMRGDSVVEDLGSASVTKVVYPWLQLAG